MGDDYNDTSTATDRSLIPLLRPNGRKIIGAVPIRV
ncbi:hypothetical protein BLA6860_05274 [Burkholderia lata]|nr:hypothetical protein BLA6860_05274 [Burkholderia lata]